MEVIKTADYIINLGSEGEEVGRDIVAAGIPEEVASIETSYTGQFLIIFIITSFKDFML